MITQTSSSAIETFNGGSASYLMMACITMGIIIIVLIYQLLKNPKKTKSPAKKSDKVIKKGKIKASYKKQLKIPKSTKDSIPYQYLYANGLMLLRDGSYSKAYSLSDANFCSVPEEEQENILTSFAEALNILPYKVSMQTVVFNKTRDNKLIEKEILMQPQRDDFNETREEFNEVVLKQKLEEGNNNIEQKKYLLLTTKSKSIKEADNILTRAEVNIDAILSQITPNGIELLKAEERLKPLYEVYNMNSPFSYGEKKVIDGTTIKVEDLTWINKQGLTSKDSIGPTSFHFSPGHFVFDRGSQNPTFGCVLYLKDVSTSIVPDITREITSIPCNMLLSTHYESEREDKALKMLKNSLSFIKNNVSNEQRRLAKEHLTPDMISEELLLEQEQATEFLQTVMRNNQKVFYVTLVIAVFADSKEKLDEYISSVKTAGIKYMCNIKELSDIQEKGLNTALPYGFNELKDGINDRSLDTLQTTSSATAFHPFTSMELMHKHGVWYGQNNVSKNMCMIDRRRGMNYNCVRAGKSGSGKSMSNKNEKTQMIMRYPQDSFYFIDPDREYGPLAKKFKGQVIKLANGSDVHINPLDMELNYGETIEEAVSLKIDFLQALCEIMAGAEMTAEVTGIIDRCGRAIYKPYIEHIQSLIPKGITIDYDAMPTLVTFYECLNEQEEELAHQLALTIEPFCTGTKNIFAFPTNVNIHSRVVVFDIFGLGKGMLELGLQVCGNFIWNKGISNKQLSDKLRRGEITKNQLPVPFIDVDSMTWADIDEFHLLTRIDSVAAVFVDYWKRARKWNICFTALSQSISDYTRTEETKTFLKNSSLVMIFNITKVEYQDVLEIINLSDSQVKYVSNPVPGRGILCWEEKTVIELDGLYPTECSLFEILSTKSGTVA